MSGHSHWAGIKHQKGIADQKRGKIFSKLLAAVTAAVGNEPNPDFNPRLRTAIQKAKDNNVPAENIARAVKRASEAGKELEDIILEAYGPGGAAVLMTAVTDNRNRTIPEIKKILSDQGGKWAESGSVRWAFDPPGGGEDRQWRAKFPQEIPSEDRSKLESLMEALREHDDIQEVYHNAIQNS